MLKKLIVPCALSQSQSPSRPVNKRCISYRAIKNAVVNYFLPRPAPTPPYRHVCQIGDPALRTPAEPVDPAAVKTAEFKKFVNHLIAVMRKYQAYGLAAPQIGSLRQVFVIEMTEAQVRECIQTKSAGQPIEVIPLTVFINPRMRIIDHAVLTYPETCCSVYGYVGNVGRAKGIQIEALNLNGDRFTWKANGWPAKVAQHEMDHLQGKLYTDRMDPKTFANAIWSIVNQRRGKVAIKFYPDSDRVRKLKNIFNV